MLDAWIIEEIERNRRQQEQTQIPLELPLPPEEPMMPEVSPPDDDRGVFIIET